MDESTAHPAVAAAFATVEEDQGFTVRGFVVRGDEAAAVLLSDGMMQRTVIIENRMGRWESPTMISGTPWDPSKRPTVSEEPWAVGQASRTQSGLPGPHGVPPNTAWLAVTALAAPDAVSVVVTTDLDSHEVTANSDGLVLALVSAPWGARPDITVRTTHGEVTRTTP
jgi:hypothetical protein